MFVKKKGFQTKELHKETAAYTTTIPHHCFREKKGKTEISHSFIFTKMFLLQLFKWLMIVNVFKPVIAIFADHLLVPSNTLCLTAFI